MEGGEEGRLVGQHAEAFGHLLVRLQNDRPENGKAGADKNDHEKAGAGVDQSRPEP